MGELIGDFDDGSGPLPTVMTGPVEIVTRNKGTDQTGTFQTEILSMSLSGDVGGVSLEIRESPSLASPGQVRVLDIGSGLYQIDSFFDVFVELSVDGGPFQPQTNEAARVQLVPEPGRLLMLLTGVPFTFWLARRRAHMRSQMRGRREG